MRVKMNTVYKYRQNDVCVHAFYVEINKYANPKDQYFTSNVAFLSPFVGWTLFAMRIFYPAVQHTQDQSRPRLGINQCHANQSLDST